MQNFEVDLIFMLIFGEKTDLCKNYQIYVEDYRSMCPFFALSYHWGKKLQICAEAMPVYWSMSSTEEIIKKMSNTYRYMLHYFPVLNFNFWQFEI